MQYLQLIYFSIKIVIIGYKIGGAKSKKTRYSPATVEFSRMLQLLKILQFTNLELTLQCLVLWDPINLHYNSSVICFLALCAASKSNGKFVF